MYKLLCGRFTKTGNSAGRRKIQVMVKWPQDICILNNDLTCMKLIQIQRIATIIERNDNFDKRLEDEIIPCVTPLHEDIRALLV